MTTSWAAIRRGWYQPSVEPGAPRNDDDPPGGHREALLVLLFVLPDDELRRDPNLLVDDRAADARMPPDVDAVHEHALGDLRVGVDPHLGAEDRALDTPARDDDAR